MNRPTIKMELDDGTNTWVVLQPVDVKHSPGQRHYDVEDAAAIAFRTFLGNFIREREIVDEHMEPFDTRARR